MWQSATAHLWQPGSRDRKCTGTKDTLPSHASSASGPSVSPCPPHSQHPIHSPTNPVIHRERPRDSSTSEVSALVIQSPLNSAACWGPSLQRTSYFRHFLPNPNSSSHTHNPHAHRWCLMHTVAYLYMHTTCAHAQTDTTRTHILAHRCTRCSPTYALSLSLKGIRAQVIIRVHSHTYTFSPMHLLFLSEQICCLSSLLNPLFQSPDGRRTDIIRLRPWLPSPSPGAGFYDRVINL
jgi:hypothetical protein